MKPKTSSRLSRRPLSSIRKSQVLTSSILLGGALCSASGAIVYEEPNVTLEPIEDKGSEGPGTADIDLDGVGGPEFTFSVDFEISPSEPLVGTIDYANGFIHLSETKGGSGPARIFAEGESIAGSFESTGLSNSLSDAVASVVDSETFYIGFKFNPSGSLVLNGWMEFQRNSTQNITLTRFAYEDTGAVLGAGETPPPPAEIVFRDGLDISSMEPTEGKITPGIAPVDIDGDGSSEFSLLSYPSNGEVGFAGILPDSAFSYKIAEGKTSDVVIFAEGEEISGSNSPASDPVGAQVALTNWFSGAADGESIYVGFGAEIGGVEVTGWMELRRDDAQTITLTRLAYNASGGPIQAGQTSVPEFKIVETEYLPDAGAGTPEFKVTFTSNSGFEYTLRRSPDLTAPFDPVGEPISGSGANLELSDPSPPAGQAFYQVEEVPVVIPE